MPNYVACPECDADVRTRDESHGARIRCEECGAKFKVGTRSASKRMSKKPARRRVPIIALAVGGALVLLIAVAIGVFLLVKSRRGSDVQAQATQGVGAGTIDLRNPGGGAGTLLAAPAASVEIDSKGSASRALHSENVLAVVAGAPYRCDSFEILSGRRTGSFELAGVEAPHAMFLSPNGTRLAVMQSDRLPGLKIGMLLSIWSVPEGQRMVTDWKPAIPKQPNQPDDYLQWCAFLSDDRLLTVTLRGRVALWSLPERTAIYDVMAAEQKSGIGLLVDPSSNVPKNFALSADRRALALQDGNGVVIVDTETGRIAKTLAPAGTGSKASREGMAFSPDSKRLAVCYTYLPLYPETRPTDREVVVWDVSTKKIDMSIPLPKNLVGGAIAWWGDRHLLCFDSGSSILFRADTGTVLRQCLPPEPETKLVSGHADGKLRYVAGSHPKKRYLVYGAPGDALAADATDDDGTGKYKRFWLTLTGIEKRPVDAQAFLGKIAILQR